MNYEWIEKTIKKKIQSKKNEKTEKNQREIAEGEQKFISEKANFCSNTVSSLYCKIRVEKLHTPQNHSLFGSTSGFDMAKINTPI